MLIGETSSGAYYGNNSGITVPIVLPSSRFLLSVPTVAYYEAVPNGPSAKSGVIPDIAVSEDIGDLVQGLDKAKATALALIKKTSLR